MDKFDKIHKTIILFLVLLFGGFHPAAQAAPPNGFGVYAGGIHASEGGVNSNGISLGADAQFAINDDWTFNPYLMVSRERNAVSNIVADGLVGLQLRRWMGDWFVGAQAFVHDRVVMGGGNVQSSAYGLAPGLIGGFESASGWGVEVQSDTFESTNSTGVRRNAVRLNFSYRWH